MRKVFVTISALFIAAASIVFAGSTGMPRLPEQQSREQQEQKRSDKYVDMKSDAGRQTQIGGRKILIAVGNFAAHHNGTVITCDSTVRYSDSHLECFGNVLINKGTTFIYGDRAEYDGEKNEARIYSDIIKVVDGTTTMYTYNFTFNTKSNIGTYTGGGVVIDDKNRLESDRGFYNADTKDIICVERVEMRDDKYQMKGDSVIYNMDTNNARFFRNTNIWNQEDNEYLYADCGEFRDSEDLYRLTENGYILTEEQELWSDSLDYYRERGYALLRHNIQIDDNKNKIIAFGDWGEYWKEPGNAFLTKNPALVSYDTEQGDSLFIRSDSMYLITKDPVAERLERERIAKHRADSIALADSLAKVAKEAEAAKAAAKPATSSEEHGEIEEEKPSTPVTSQQRREQALAALDKMKKSNSKGRGEDKGRKSQADKGKTPSSASVPSASPKSDNGSKVDNVAKETEQGAVATPMQAEVKSSSDSTKVDTLAVDSLATLST